MIKNKATNDWHLKSTNNESAQIFLSLPNLRAPARPRITVTGFFGLMQN